MAWKDLSIRDKAAYIASSVASGNFNLNRIKEDFNSNIEHFKNADANFVQRLNNNDTRSIVGSDGLPQTHRLGWEYEGNHAIIYPEVQDNNGVLEPGDLQSAIERRDTIHTSTPFARYYTKNYKKDYPEFFNQFEDGGKKKQPWFVRASLGAMMADAPAVATASGWTYDNNGDIAQTEQDSEGAEQLRKSLSELSSIPLSELGVGIIGEAIAGTKAYKSYIVANELNKAIKKSPYSIAPKNIEPIIRTVDDMPLPVSSSDYSITRVPSFNGINIGDSEHAKRFAEDVYEGAVWGLNRGQVESAKTDLIRNIDMNNLIGHGAESYVFKDPYNSRRVLKVLSDSIDPGVGRVGSGFETPEEAVDYAERALRVKNSRPYNLRENIIGVVEDFEAPNTYSPVTSQRKVVDGIKYMNDNSSAIDFFDRFASRIGDDRYVFNSSIKPNEIIVENNLFEPYINPFGEMDGFRSKDFKPANIGVLPNGVVMGIDLRAYGGNLFSGKDKNRPTQKMHMWGEFDYPETIKPSANKYERISNDRYNSAFNALTNAGYKGGDADRLAQILASQSITETGWVDKNDTHNYAGYLNSKGKLIKYDSPEHFWSDHISNLSSKWPEWNTTNNTDEYFDIVNHTNLGLNTLDKFNRYNKAHRDNPVYIYAPDWQNKNYSGRMKSVSKRASKYFPKKLGPIY